MTSETAINNWENKSISEIEYCSNSDSITVKINKKSTKCLHAEQIGIYMKNKKKVQDEKNNLESSI